MAVSQHSKLHRLFPFCLTKSVADVFLKKRKKSAGHKRHQKPINASNGGEDGKLQSPFFFVQKLQLDADQPTAEKMVAAMVMG